MFTFTGDGNSSSLASIGSWINVNPTRPAATKTAPAPQITTNLSTSSAPQINYYAEQPSISEKQTGGKGKKTKKKNAASSNSAKVERDESSVHGTETSIKIGKSSKTNGKPGSKPQVEEKSVVEDIKSNEMRTIEPAVTATSLPSTSGKDVNTAKNSNSKKKGTSSNGSSDSLTTTEKSSILVEKTSTPAKSNKRDQKVSKKMAALEAELDDVDYPSLPVTFSKPQNVSQKPAKLIDDDFPSLPLGKPKTIQEKRTKKQVSNKMVNLTDEEFPSLALGAHVDRNSSLTQTDSTSHTINTSHLSVTESAVKPVSKPPPGFGAVSAPPGLGLSNPYTNGSSVPPGLKTSESPLDISSIADFVLSKQSTDKDGIYLEPANFTERNKKLKVKLESLIFNDTAIFQQFKNYTLDFRNSTISAARFRDDVESLLGKDIFLEILPELLVLLPDLSRQQALYKLCVEELTQFRKTRVSTTKDVTLTLCDTCAQVLMVGDVLHHKAQHVATDDFPTLSNHVALKAARQAW